MENAWSYQLKNGRIGTKNTLFYTPLKRAEIGQLCRLSGHYPIFGFCPVWRKSGNNQALRQKLGSNLGPIAAENHAFRSNETHYQPKRINKLANHLLIRDQINASPSPPSAAANLSDMLHLEDGTFQSDPADGSRLGPISRLGICVQCDPKFCVTSG